MRVGGSHKWACKHGKIWNGPYHFDIGVYCEKLVNVEGSNKEFAYCFHC